MVRYWGYVALALIIFGWATHALAYAAILIISFLTFIYFLIQAPLTCGAETRGGQHCRNNSDGILIGCHIRQHKWQKARDIFVSRKWHDIYRDLFGTAKDLLGTVSALISVVSVFVALPLVLIR